MTLNASCRSQSPQGPEFHRVCFRQTDPFPSSLVTHCSVCPAVLLSVCGGQLPSILWKLIVWTVSLIFFFCFPSVWKWNPTVFKLGLCRLSLSTLLILRAVVLHLGEAPETRERICLSSFILPQALTHCSPEFCGRLIGRAVSECKCTTLYSLSIGYKDGLFWLCTS